MSGAASREVLRHLNTLFHCGAAGPLSDEELLERFVAGDREAAEAAFAALVNRHGAMVLGVCRRVLGNRHAAEDAFQATFLVLARKAPAIARRQQLASWLHGVARRAALDARARSERQKRREKRLGAMLPVEPPDQTLTSELRAILDEELGRLPERHRAAIVVCELEGLSRREAAGRLGITEGTLSSRLARAKARLRDRLTRRGLALSTAILASTLTQESHAVTVPAALVDSAIRVATLVAAGSSLAGVVSTSVVTLTEGVLKAMLLAKLKLVILGLAALALFTTGVGVLAQDGPSDQDRLKNVERKLDKLLEVLGGSSHRAPAGVPVPNGLLPPPEGFAPMRQAPGAPSALAPPPAPGTPLLKLSFPGAPPILVPLPVVALPELLPMPAQPPRSPGFGPATAPAPAGVPGRPGQPKSLAGRVDALEQRLSNLERHIVVLQRRLQQIETGANLPPNLPASDSRFTQVTTSIAQGADATTPAIVTPTPAGPAGADAAPSPFVQDTPTPAINPGAGGATPSPDATPVPASPPSPTPRGN
ncbi:MAG: sigma-70 family RNA polymerase sigma factor [Isosphaerales bacterium]